ncbi:metallophosphoesterase [Paraclostridium sordellii]|uniref:metallophosphoesterase n=1 Tax=Paraclostridium sordellii TaxID=1505 RepID=UPI0005DE78E0|nr:metallophosphoesterase [Paeniclostridium sordellii]CEN92678.1 membrane-associated nucleotidase [[Clostridium] sordellii] [Paeniclostridium sordellii]CEN96560.1 membrane-associated nucleotidase [[Clostridium] sordellii] [Paeniclostridium sordellii]
MKKKALLGALGLSTFLIGGCTSTKTTDINILATSDLHGVIPYEMVTYVENEKKKDKNTTVVDAGDFFDREFGTSEDMEKFFEQRRKDSNNGVVAHREIPIAKEMKEAGFDTVTLGNHEFVSNDKINLDNIIYDFEKQGISVLSANTYKKNGDSYTKPYVIKEIKTSEGTVKLGILGLTIKEVGESKDYVDGKLVHAKSLELKDQKQYNGELYMNDLVEDAKKWVKVMKEKDKADVIIAVAHTGEKPKKPKNPGNRIQDLAQNVDGIDAIVAGHNHVQIKQHDYKNKSGENVIVTEPGKHGECMSKINLKLEKSKDGWEVASKSSDIVQFDKNTNKKLFDNKVEVMIAIDDVSEKLGEKISLSKISDLKWDKAYVFKPETSREKIYDTVGYKFARITETDDVYRVILMDKDKVVFYSDWQSYLMPYTIDFDNADFKDGVFVMTPGKNDYFKIAKGDKNPNNGIYSTRLIYQKN